MENTPHLSVDEVAKRFDVSRRTLQRWRVDGTGPVFIKVNGRVKYRQMDVQQYEESCLRNSTSERASAGGNA